MSAHVLVAIDLTVESLFLLEKAESFARSLNARLSLFYNGSFNSEGYLAIAYDPKIRINRKSSDKTTPEHRLNELLGNTKYPIENTFIGSGNYIEEIECAVGYV